MEIEAEIFLENQGEANVFLSKLLNCIGYFLNISSFIHISSLDGTGKYLTR